MNCRQHNLGWRNLWDTPNLLMQKFPAPTFTATAKVKVALSYEGDRMGLVVMGQDYATLEVTLRDGSIEVDQRYCLNAESGTAEIISQSVDFDGGDIWLRCIVEQGALCQFQYSLDGRRFKSIGDPFVAKAGKWIGAKIGCFAVADIKRGEGGRMDVDWFRIER